jgi:molybdate/tungstate transport system substrate-binding protein
MGRKILVLFLLAGLFSCQPKKQTRQIIIFHAGSLSYPLKAAIQAFNQQFPEITIVTEAAGSVASARKITELNRKADIMASADYQIIDQLLIPQHASFNIHFVTNSIGLAYTKKSHFADSIQSNNWREILRKEHVKIGASDPDADPCGYRTRMIWQLTALMYNDSSLKNDLLAENKYYQRPKETDLIALLETNSLDYIFIYKSVAIQHHLDFIELGDSLNLANPDLNNWYSNVSENIRGTEPGTFSTIQAEAITYGITMLNDSPNQKDAMLFLNWLLNEENGLKVLAENGLIPLQPSRVRFVNSYPENLKINNPILLN